MKIQKISIWAVGGFLLISSGGFWSHEGLAARKFADISVTEQSEERSQSGAKQEIFKKATLTVSEKYIREIIGDEKYKKNKGLIENKILNNSSKYILFMKSGDMRRSSAGLLEMDVTFKISLESLRSLLLAQGLLYAIEGPPKLLPLVTMENRVEGASLTWWADDSQESSQFLRRELANFHQALRGELTPKGFFSIKAGESVVQNSLPSALKQPNPPTRDLILIGGFFGAQIIVAGDIQIRKSQQRSDVFEVYIRLSALYSNNARVVGEVIRLFTTSPGDLRNEVRKVLSKAFPSVTKDLTKQLYEAWKSGTFGSAQIKLSFAGDMTFQQVEKLKAGLINSMSDLKTLKERKFSQRRVVFEADSEKSSQALAEVLVQTKFPGFRVSVEDIEADSLRLGVQFN